MSIQVRDKHEVGSPITQSQIEVWKNSYCKGCSEDEMQLFINVCMRTGLSPEMRQIFPVPRWDNKLGRNVMTIQTGIDGYRLIAEKTGKYVPGREPTFAYKDGKLFSATAYVKKLGPDGSWHEVAATAIWDEYCQKAKDGNPTKFWKDMSHTMLAKCAESLVLRRAFPADMCGVYTREEMEQADREHVNTATGLLATKHESNPVLTTNESVPTQAEVLISKTQLEEIEAKIGSDEFDKEFRKNMLGYLKIDSLSMLSVSKLEMVNKWVNKHNREKLASELQKAGESVEAE